MTQSKSDDMAGQREHKRLIESIAKRLYDTVKAQFVRRVNRRDFDLRSAAVIAALGGNFAPNPSNISRLSREGRVTGNQMILSILSGISMVVAAVSMVRGWLAMAAWLRHRQDGSMRPTLDL
jgi:hypothetical protein